MTSPLKDFYHALGSVEQDLLIDVLNDTVTDASESSTKPLRSSLTQLQVEVEREIRRKDGILAQLESTERLITTVERQLGQNGSAEMHLMLSMLRDRAMDLNGELSKLGYSEKMARRIRIRQTILSLERRASAARRIIDSLRAPTSS